MSTSTRTLRLLALLQTHRHWTGAELADRLTVSERTLRRDVDRLRELGYPVGADRGTGGGYQLSPGASLPPLVVDDDEAVAIVVGLHGAADRGVDGLDEPAVRALAKIARVLPPRPRRRVDALRSAAIDGAVGEERTVVDAEVLTTIAQAARDDEVVTFVYRTREGATSSREVAPHRLVSLHRRWYLVAYDRTRNDWRTFRTDRTEDVRTAGRSFHPRTTPFSDPGAFVRAGIGDMAHAFLVEAVVDAPAEHVRREVAGYGDVEPLSPGRCRVRLPADGLDWPAMVLGSTGAPFRIVSPPELNDTIRAWRDRFTTALQPPHSNHRTPSRQRHPPRHQDRPTDPPGRPRPPVAGNASRQTIESGTERFAGRRGPAAATRRPASVSLTGCSTARAGRE